MLKIKFKYIFSFLLTLTILTGCTEEFITLEPQSLETKVSFFADFESVEKAVINAYHLLNREKVFDLYPVILGSIASDDADVGGLGINDGADFEEINRMIHQSNNPLFKFEWSYLYRGVYSCNFALQNIDVVLENDPDANPDKVSQRIGELKFLRSLYFFYLAKIYGGVPVFDHVLEPDEYQILTRNTLKETYDFIKTDLRDAIERLPHATDRSMIPESEVGRATKGSAQALLGIVYLYESSYAKNYSGVPRFEGLKSQWDSALYYSEQVINSGDYYLLGLEGETYESEFSDKTPGYKQIWTLAGENSSESVFETQAIYDQDKQWIASRGSVANIFFTVRGFFNSDGSSSPLGWGFNTPTDDLMNAYESGDPRYKISILEEEDSVLVYGDNGLGMYKADIQHSETGRMGRKYEVHPDYYWNMPGRHPSDGPTNYKLIRYAEVILNAAEAAFELGQNGKATNYVNMIRKRARNSGSNPSVLPDLPSVDLEDIMQERRVELALEGQRFFDLVRWGIADNKLNGLETSYGDVIQYETGKHEFYPIPQSEIAATNNTLKQNNNY